ncbi:methyltransferase [Pseudarthrobacter chlorophenolicus A6]|uniref:S-adenosyl-L-methionine-dependent methyltransferase n=1 Tax=Pseudarthrobacter chlorophenolicus (strain ATCC 700700 / DSM 12829 / CIP 107037 / JCM 12360 / KCTC 9906 / NCIMB 13794 / A6) TaxID=452863 RepID=B8HDK7_PSECP|nr:SAM-dependent methyltransferase [Pseudarthrobacter chlorophenolicus]ACL39012.1 methyltransferase [Pseudarthrobacter chlorophenolicus A6]SDR05623.1 methyltransferase, TIGR00027 family [Pseudarthrobacter chlorophenolicus]
MADAEGTGFQDHGLPLTALAVAAGRAVESSRPDPLVVDPFAAELVRAAKSHVEMPTQWPASPEDAPPLQQPLLLASIYIGLRTRFIDDFLRDGATAQTVILGAGLDTRAFRLEWPAGSRIFEIDSASVLDFKDSVLTGLGATPGTDRTILDADLSQPWRRSLMAAGFDPAGSTTWILEGLLPYLDAAGQQSVLDEVAALSSPGSRAVIERAVPLPKTDDLDAQLQEFSLKTGLPMSELLARADPPDPVSVLEASGWRCARHSVPDLCASYGRVISLTDAPAPPLSGNAPDAGAEPPSSAEGQSRGGFATAWL